MCLHKIRIEKISLFHLKKCAVNDFRLLPVKFQVQPICALRYIISAYCINHSLDKQSFLA